MKCKSIKLYYRNTESSTLLFFATSIRAQTRAKRMLKNRLFPKTKRECWSRNAEQVVLTSKRPSQISDSFKDKPFKSRSVSRRDSWCCRKAKKEGKNPQHLNAEYVTNKATQRGVLGPGICLLWYICPFKRVLAARRELRPGRRV